MDTIQFAKAYASRGWQLFPIVPRDKTPLVRWDEAATIDEKMLSGWWDNFPDANIAIACGERSGVFVLDIDAGKGGYESLADLISENGKLPDTPVSKTGGGGEHIFFRYPKGANIRNSVGKIAPGIDVRADGGYVVAPPSIHKNGNVYSWVVKPSEVELADAPQWLLDLIIKHQPPKEKPIQSGGRVVEGGRNDYLARMAGAMRRVGFGEDAIFSALRLHNTERCQPPLTEGEVYQIAHSIQRYEPSAEPIVEEPIAKNIPSAYDGIEMLEDEIRRRSADPREVWGIPYAWDFLSRVTGGKQAGELVYIGGEPGVGKSWWAHQDALFTAIGRKIGSYDYGETPVLLWSGEMKKRQVYRRFFEMLGVPKRAMQTGNMDNYHDPTTGELVPCWQLFNEAKAIIMNSPIYVADMPLELSSIEDLLRRAIDKYGIKQTVFDYDWLIAARGQNEIEQSQNISREMKRLAGTFDLAVILISSVNKAGMSGSDAIAKANLSGSGKKIHDADVIFTLNKFNEKTNPDISILPRDYWKIATLRIEKGRELDYSLPKGAINYMRETPNPKFREMKRADERPNF